ncbi:LytR/AlgR family response regulator transcription factor [Aurantibacter aestuarii]|uniref:DNA-binding response regulator n=1 Tax=Aurantibacter aestuarii TaxID=1266046 RepID=A0A2T1NBC5_9FLAO|nr:response regulator transcription factor [Aurantibacter aestuarii]PSG89430.1 hypothetical protein C7H52_06555 [Aurantibacter aestuarii]
MVFSKKILIVEDEIMISDFIFKMLNNSGFTNVKVANNSEDALFTINNFKPEILLLDINVEGKDSGIELAKQKNIEANVIYITAQNDNATIQKAIATNPITYLTKPLKKTDLLAAIQLANFKTKTQSILIKDGFEEIKLSLDDLLFIKSDGNYIDIYTNTKKISIRESLEKFYEKLDENQFLRIHRSIIINQNKITKKTATSVFIYTTELPISRNYKKNIEM